MKITHLHFGILILVSSCTPTTNSREKVAHYLKTNFPRVDTLFETTLVYDDSLINENKTPWTTKATGLQVYSTQLTTGYYEYPTVKVAIAITTDDKIEVFQSPTFTDENSNFLTLFKDICVNNDVAKIEITEEIANIFRDITTDGSIKNMLVTKKGTSCALMIGDTYWRQLNFYFDQNCLQSVDFVVPK